MFKLQRIIESIVKIIPKNETLNALQKFESKKETGGGYLRSEALGELLEVDDAIVVLVELN